MTKLVALVAVPLLSISSMPYGKKSADIPRKPAQESVSASEAGAASKADSTLKSAATDAPAAAKEAVHETAAAEAGARAARLSTQDIRQLRGESEHWANHYARLYGVPAKLVYAIIEQESGWNPYAVSGKGAAGLMQLMPATARRFGVRNRFCVDENIRGGVAYLAALSAKFNGDLRLATAAYYGGEYQISSRLEESSPDVQAYVRRIAEKSRERRTPAKPDIPSPQTTPTPQRSQSGISSTNSTPSAASHQQWRMSARRCAADNTDAECVLFE